MWEILLWQLQPVKQNHSSDQFIPIQTGSMDIFAKGEHDRLHAVGLPQADLLER